MEGEEGKETMMLSFDRIVFQCSGDTPYDISRDGGAIKRRRHPKRDLKVWLPLSMVEWILEEYGNIKIPYMSRETVESLGRVAEFAYKDSKHKPKPIKDCSRRNSHAPGFGTNT